VKRVLAESSQKERECLCENGEKREIQRVLFINPPPHHVAKDATS